MPSEMPNETMESVRHDFTEEADANGLVGLHTARNPTAYNFSLKNWGTELRWEMSDVECNSWDDFVIFT